MPTNVLKIHRKTNHVVDIWGKLKFKQSFTILEKSVPEIQNISRVDLLWDIFPTSSLQAALQVKWNKNSLKNLKWIRLIFAFYKMH